jgi:cobalt/nickel transport system permease protein
MTHLHIPDGVLPVWLWGPAWVLALALLVASARSRTVASPQTAYRGALGALMLAVMALQVPLGPLHYHLTLAGPVGVLLGSSGSFQVIFVVSAMLAFIGHGGFTLIGLNTLVLGAGAALAAPLFRRMMNPWSPPIAMALATIAAQVISGILWLMVMALAVRWTGATAGLREVRTGFVFGLVIPVGLMVIALESLVAFGMGRFLARVRPDLLPHASRVGPGSGV